MIIIIAAVILYLTIGVLTYGRAKEDKYGDEFLIRMGFVPFLQFAFFVVALMDKRPSEKWFQFRDPAKLKAKRDAKLKAALPEFDCDREDYHREMFSWR
jgi:hypothetical protein